jgi:hypothetical protein
MRHRLYYMLPNVESARQVLNDLLLARIEQRYIHFMTGGQELPSDLPQANLLQKTDVVHGAESGMLIGGALGVALGIIIVLFPFEGLTSHAAVVLIAAVAGVLFGGWSAAMMGVALPNTRLKLFYPEIEHGRILLIVDVPARRIGEIEELISRRHPETSFGGEEPNIPAFP